MHLSIGHRQNAAAFASGFSLLETLIALSIVAVLTAVAAPHFANRTSALALQSESHRLLLFLERCSSYALTSRSTVEVAISSSTLSALQESKTVIAQHTIRHAAHLEPLPGGASSLFFYPSISASPATLNIIKGKLSCAVVISLRGRIRSTC
ncbi:MAG: Tfp pilus assembly protein FimT/FimU [Pseudomonadota bacterium]|jgi:prepilin-type N-terminal cleavage/methylation domain-containing protein